MSDKVKNTAVKITMISGTQHNFTMASEKALMFSQTITGYKLAEDKKWIDAWDFTEAKSGQMLLCIASIESVSVETPG